ncbi:MAG: transposase family protein [Flavobacteriales bacterium]|jgi:transposase InsO family protein|nr:transposase family protein [Flavobacteriales bacterium]
MIVNLHTQALNSLDEVRAFLEGSSTVSFVAPDPAERYRWLAATLRQFHYDSLGRADKGTLRAFMVKVTGYSRAQLTRLIQQWSQTRSLVDHRGPPATPFTTRYTEEDVRALATLDRLHQQPAGPAARKLAERMARIFHDPAYERLATISVSHLYNLRATDSYQRLRGHHQPTQARAVTIGERRRPDPQGQPGYLRVDSVHQGDWDGVKGLYIINLVDAVTQYEVVAAVERISENFLIPVLEKALATFPFAILGFHTDNGSEYINHRVAGMLNKLNVEFTKSRARRTNDNALVESKNASVVRKYMGYSHIPSRYAGIVNDFLTTHLTPYLNFHRPCFFPEIVIDDKGRQRRRYPKHLINTPYEKLKALPNAERFLKPGLTLTELERKAHAMTDNQAAKELLEARKKLFRTIQAKQAA